MDDHGTPADTSDDTQVCTIASLPAGNSQTCFHSGQAKPGPYVNIGKVTGTPPGGLGSINATDPSHYFGVHLDITLVKKTNGIDASTPPGPKINHGSPITWSYQVNNHSNVAVSNIVIKDDNGTAGSSEDDYIVCNFTSLAKNESQTCTSNGSAILGSYANLAIVTAFYNAVEISASDSSYYTGMQAEFKVFMPLVKR